MTEKEQITVAVELEKKDVVSLMFYAFTRRIAFKILMVVLILFCILFIPSRIMNGEPITETSDMLLLLIVIFIVLMPLILYFTASREYDSNLRLHEKQIVTIGQSEIHIKGESFESQLSWSKVYKFTESKKYFYIWQSKNSANIIPKRCLSAEDIDLLRRMK